MWVFHLLARILEEPLWLVLWVGWLMLVNTASLLFVRREEARWVLAAWVANIALMTVLFEVKGYSRLLGLPHLIFWTPLLAALLRRRTLLGERNAYAGWLRLLVLTDGLSLLVDAVDVARYLAGDRG